MIRPSEVWKEMGTSVLQLMFPIFILVTLCHVERTFDALITLTLVTSHAFNVRANRRNP